MLSLNGVEKIATNVPRGADAVAVGDLTRTDTSDVAVNLGADTLDGGAGANTLVQD